MQSPRIRNSHEASVLLDRFCRESSITVVHDFFLNEECVGIFSPLRKLIWVCAGEQRPTFRNRIWAHEVCHWLIAEEKDFRDYFDPRTFHQGLFYHLEELTCNLFANYFVRGECVSFENHMRVRHSAQMAFATKNGKKFADSYVTLIKRGEFQARLLYEDFCGRLNLEHVSEEAA